MEGAPIFAKRKISSNFSVVGFEQAKAKSYVSSELIAPPLKSELALDYTFDISFAPKIPEKPPELPVSSSPASHSALAGTTSRAIEPASPTIHDAGHSTQHAKKLFDEGRYQECLEHLIKIGSSESADPLHLTLLARAYSNEGNLTAALNWIEKAIMHDKLNQALYFVRATILQALDNMPEAISSLRKALFLDPNFVVAEFHLATLLQQTGKAPEAEKRFQNALKLLKKFGRDEIVPESDGITAGRLSQIVEGLVAENKRR
jgi:chemotaxis protein methyltransferase CheR